MWFGMTPAGTRLPTSTVLGSARGGPAAGRGPGSRSRPRPTMTSAIPRSRFDGTNYLVAWQDNPSSSGEHYESVYAARVSPGRHRSGSRRNSRLAGWARAEGDPAVASDGTNYLVVWDKSPDLSGQNRDILAARVSPTGEVLDPTGKARFPGGGQPTHSHGFVRWKQLPRSLGRSAVGCLGHLRGLV